MTKETKSVLTREGIKKDLLGELRTGILSLCALLMIFFVIGLILTFIAFRPGVGRVLCGLSFVALIVWLAVIYARSYVLIARDRFAVVEDTFLYAAEETVHQGRRLKLERVLYFERYGRYVLSPVDGSVFDYSNEGDRFYLVVYEEKTQKSHKNQPPIRVYNARIYEYR